tara:strand:+ start:3472 stop:3900 length:429 start_codon:yes stop_codon:yes gene_type:complete
MKKFKDFVTLVLGCLIFLLLTEPARADTQWITVKDSWEVIRTEKIYVNVEKKTETGRVYTCKDVKDHSDAIGKAMILAIAGSMIDSEHAILGAFTGLVTGNSELKRVCYDEIQYETHVIKQYSHTLITLSNGKIEVQKKIIE